ncbi:karyopherin KAP114 KNAG_0D02940 [Huiozyma naganishii CBS 8797]|uniref:Importin N-terminal domain-containing protein n=1 Tax=Huiozyma naganishii (strain ATCC MYA-139 / BCRC 22969 / CBS 8797 / KCTC 17520 / NBRC 10181 / NCYC 3082 / Yp74L-3) TaxID=1071383 RepID=J7RKM0_HUIN7|nr:hypothetical protein KNAG_0D02940 [Kazachstania naganishii CBS 8797]CCK70043.1 hypothetical protein KNAG_0D02940 [Kazachstania naganishii CBS 8797]
MNMDELIALLQSPDNSVRTQAESNLMTVSDEDASHVLQSLINVALNSAEKPLTERQFALLSMRKLITFYWSPAFESYRNTATLDLLTKQYVRDSLLQLSLNDSQDTKIKKSASYCIVQISAVDFPDEWPKLLEELYGAITNFHSLSAISLLNEIYDDVISEEMFFEGGIGLETLQIIFQLLSSDASTIEAKLAAINLFHATLLQMSTVDSHTTQEKRKEMVRNCVPICLDTLRTLLEGLADINSALPLQLKGSIYKSLEFIKNKFPTQLFPSQFVEYFKIQAVRDLVALQINQDSFADDTVVEAFNECAIHVIELISSIEITEYGTEDQHAILKALLSLSRLDANTKESWTTDFNDFVSKETGLAASFTIRDQVADYLGTPTGAQSQTMFENILQLVSDILSSNADPTTIESSLFLLQSVLAEDTDFSVSSPQTLVQLISALIGPQTINTHNDSILRSRIILTIPKILDVFMDSLPNIKQLTKDLLLKTLQDALSSTDELIFCSTLIAFTYYVYFAELPSVLGSESCRELQEAVLGIVNHVASEAEEDTNGLLIEVLNHVISCNVASTDFKLLQKELTAMLSISSKDPSNIEVSVESQECLEKLLDNINTERYNKFISICLPSFVNIIKGNQPLKYKYNPLLSLILEFVRIFMKKKPTNGMLPRNFSEGIIALLVDILERSEEDETLQLATAAFSHLLNNTDPTIVIQHLTVVIKVLKRLLSMFVSDTAAQNVGTLIVTLFNKYSKELTNLIPDILESAIYRLIDAKNVTTQENLISLICYVTCCDPLQMVNFLFKFSESERRDIPSLMFNKWFETFEIVRGERKIKDNIIALSKIFFLSDFRLTYVKVNGDLLPYEGDRIITRSMAKEMPDRYTQIDVYSKIVKVFVTELQFRNKQPDAERLITSDIKHSDELAAAEGNDDDGWEDVDDVLDYEKLKEFVDDDDDREDSVGLGNDADEITGIDAVPQSATQLLTAFFKEAMTNNVNGFQEMYNALSESERTILSQCLL